MAINKSLASTGFVLDKLKPITDSLIPVKSDIDALKALGGLAPGDVNDATAANLIATDGTETRAELNTAIADETSHKADSAALTEGLALKADLTRLDGKADLTGGRVPESQLPERLSNTALSAAIDGSIGAQVPALAAQAVADSPTVVAAAEAAVDGAIVGLDLVKSADDRLSRAYETEDGWRNVALGPAGEIAFGVDPSGTTFIDNLELGNPLTRVSVLDGHRVYVISLGVRLARVEDDVDRG